MAIAASLTVLCATFPGAASAHMFPNATDGGPEVFETNVAAESLEAPVADVANREPAALALFGSGLIGRAYGLRRGRSRADPLRTARFNDAA